MAPLTAFIENLFKPGHLLVVVIVGILIFGKRLPEIARSLGKSIVELKKGMRGLEDDLDPSHASPAARPESVVEQIRPPQRVQATAPKFEDDKVTAAPPHNTAPHA
jgi:sec-independent protein translocase protein TatA